MREKFGKIIALLLISSTCFAGSGTIERAPTPPFDGGQIDNPLIIDVTDPTALLVRKDGDLGNVLTIDTDTSVISLGGNLNISAASTTTGFALNINDANSLTSGAIARLVSNSPDPSGRNLLFAKNTNTLATGTTTAQFVQEAANTNTVLTQDGNGIDLLLQSNATTNAALKALPTLQTSASIISIPNADTLTSGGIFNGVSASNDNTPRNLFFLRQSSTTATSAVVARYEQDGPAGAFVIDRTNTSSTNAAWTINDSNTSSGGSIKINKVGTGYGNSIGIVGINRTGSFTGVNGETSIDLSVSPNYTMTEPGAGAFNVYGESINMNNVAVTAGAGTSTVAALNLIAGTDTDAGQNLALNTTGDSLFKGRILGNKGADVASSTTISLTNSNAVSITGSTNIDFITTTGWSAGSMIILKFNASPTVRHNIASPPSGSANIQLSGSVNFGATANDTLTLYFDGGAWREIARTVI